MSVVILPIPEEPLALKAVVRTLLEQAPDEGLPLVLDGAWIAAPLWERWGDALERRGMSRPRFEEIVASHGNEIRLWVVGERPWEHAAGGLAGRVARRLNVATASANGHTPAPRWQDALSRVGIAPDAEMPALMARLDELQLLYEIPAPPGRANDTGQVTTIVWAGARPRDPEAPVGEAEPGATGASALAEALGRFLLKDPAYPPR